MLQILIGILYSSLLCWGWGYSFFFAIQKYFTQPGMPKALILCMLGLSIIGTTSMIFHIFFPLGGWGYHVIIALPIACIILFMPKGRSDLLITVKNNLHIFKGIPGIFFISLLLLILLLGSWYIGNLDSIAYHIPIIEWNLKYPLVKGIANINGRLGYQSSWFILCAVFNYNFLGSPAITFINSTVIFWLSLFLTAELNRILREKVKLKDVLLWFCLTSIVLGSTSQVYITASSANPDFIICLYLWLCYYLVLQYFDAVNNISFALVLLFMIGFTFTLKITALPAIFLLPVIYPMLSPLKRSIKILLIVMIPAISILPFLYHNIIISGYPLFPTLFFDKFNVDWKLDPELVRKISNYISLYARVGDANMSEIAIVQKMNFGEWSRLWWLNYGFTEKALLFSALIATLINCVLIRRYLTSYKILGIITLICTVSSILLMANAPAPRFSQAFLIPVILAPLFLVMENSKLLVPKKLLIAFTLAGIIIIFTYNGYRFYHYFETQNIWKPYGQINSAVKSRNCKGITVYFPDDPNGCGDSPIPCAYNGCETFSPRGNSIEDGFRPVKN